MCMLFGYGAASTRPSELLRFGWRKAAHSDAVARLAAARGEGGPSRNISHNNALDFTSFTESTLELIEVRLRVFTSFE